MLNLGKEGKPLANLVMAVASYTPAKSVVEYSESPLYHYQYSSIGKLFERLLISVDKDTENFKKKVLDFLIDQVPNNELIKMQLDTLPVHKQFSPTHPGRTAVYKPNQTIATNKPVEIGYSISSMNIGFPSNWSIPLDFQRVGIETTGVKVGIKQIQGFLEKNTQAKVVATSDSSYGNAEYISTLHGEPNLICIVRMANRNVFEYSPKKNKTGAGTIYGKCYSLQSIDFKTKRKNPLTKETAAQKPSILQKQSDETCTYPAITGKGRKINVVLNRYKKMLVRTKKSFKMKDKFFDLVVVEHFDDITKKPLHRKPIFLSFFGKEKDSLPLIDIYKEHYQHRYDIEPNNRFVKQQLHLDKFQTPIQGHFDLWLLIIQLAEWLLFVASDEVSSNPKKWQKPVEKPKNKENRLTIAQTRKGCQALFLNFDQTPFLPKISNKGDGRKKGTVFPKKEHFKPVKKSKKRGKMVHNQEKYHMNI